MKNEPSHEPTFLIQMKTVGISQGFNVHAIQRCQHLFEAGGTSDIAQHPFQSQKVTRGLEMGTEWEVTHTHTPKTFTEGDHFVSCLKPSITTIVTV